MYLISWNVAGWSTTSQTIREHYGNLANFFNMTTADVICIQETKISRERLQQEPEQAGAADPPLAKPVPPVCFSSSPSPAWNAPSPSTIPVTARLSMHPCRHPPSFSAVSSSAAAATALKERKKGGIPGWESFWAHSAKQHRGMNGVVTFVKEGLAHQCDNQPFLPCDIREEGTDEKERPPTHSMNRVEKEHEEEEKMRRKKALVECFHAEGRCVVVYLSDVIIVNVYVPNARGGERFDFKMQFLKALQSLLSRLRSGSSASGSSPTASSSSSPLSAPLSFPPRPVILVGDLNLTYRAQDAAWWFRRLDLRVLDALHTVLQQQRRPGTHDGDPKDESTSAAAAALGVVQAHVSFHFPPTAPFFAYTPPLAPGGRTSGVEEGSHRVSTQEWNALAHSPPPPPSSHPHWLTPALLATLIAPEVVEGVIERIKAFLLQEVFIVLAWLKEIDTKKKKESKKEEEAIETAKGEKKKGLSSFSSSRAPGAVTPLPSVAAEDRPMPWVYSSEAAPSPTTTRSMPKLPSTTTTMASSIPTTGKNEKKKGSSSVVAPRVVSRPASPPSIAIDSTLASAPTFTTGMAPRVPYDDPSQFSVPRLTALAERLEMEKFHASFTPTAPVLPPSASSPDTFFPPSSSAASVSSISLSSLVEAGLHSVHLSDFLHGSSSSSTSSFTPSSSSAWNEKVMFPLSKLVGLPPHADANIRWMREWLQDPTTRTGGDGDVVQGRDTPVMQGGEWEWGGEKDEKVVRGPSNAPNGPPPQTKPPMWDSFFIPSTSPSTCPCPSCVHYAYTPVPFTCWDQQRNRRHSNEGTRLDYILIDDQLKHLVVCRGETANNVPLTASSPFLAVRGAWGREGGKSVQDGAEAIEDETEKEEKKIVPSFSIPMGSNEKEEGAGHAIEKEEWDEKGRETIARKRVREEEEEEVEAKDGCVVPLVGGGTSLACATAPAVLTLPWHCVKEYFYGEYFLHAPHYRDGIQRATAAGAYLPAPYGGGGVPPLPLAAREAMWYGVPSTGLVVTPPQYSDHIGVGLLLRDEEMGPAAAEEEKVRHSSSPLHGDDGMIPSRGFSLHRRPVGGEVRDMHPPCAYKPPRTLFSFLPAVSVGEGKKEKEEEGGKGGNNAVPAASAPSAVPLEKGKKEEAAVSTHRQTVKEEKEGGGSGGEEKKKKRSEEEKEFFIVS